MTSTLVLIRDRPTAPADPVVLVGIPYRWLPLSAVRELPRDHFPVVIPFTSPAAVRRFLAARPPGWWLNEIDNGAGLMGRPRMLRRSTVGV